MARAVHCSQTGKSTFIVLKAQMDVPGIGNAPTMQTHYATTPKDAEKKARALIEKGAQNVTYERISGMWTCAPESRGWGPEEVLEGKRPPR